MDGGKTQPANDDWKVDPILATFVSMMEARKIADVTVTLWTGGVLVSGRIASLTEYLDGTAETFDRAASDPSKSFGEVVRILIDNLPDVDPEAELAEDKALRRFIHLRNAQTFAPGTGHPIPSGAGVWWRGRLDAVDGWCFGELRAG